MAVVHKVETEFAMEFCSKLLGGAKRGCAIRLTNMDNKQTRCVMVVQPGDPAAVAHGPCTVLARIIEPGLPEGPPRRHYRAGLVSQFSRSLRPNPS